MSLLTRFHTIDYNVKKIQMVENVRSACLNLRTKSYILGLGIPSMLFQQIVLDKHIVHLIFSVHEIENRQFHSKNNNHGKQENGKMRS